MIYKQTARSALGRSVGRLLLVVTLLVVGRPTREREIYIYVSHVTEDPRATKGTTVSTWAALVPSYYVLPTRTLFILPTKLVPAMFCWNSPPARPATHEHGHLLPSVPDALKLGSNSTHSIHKRRTSGVVPAA
jgi:hypothetical protein